MSGGARGYGRQETLGLQRGVCCTCRMKPRSFTAIR
jgi:hypothetical protein